HLLKRDGVDRGRRQDGPIIIVHGRRVVGVMFENLVRLQMPMNDDMNVPVFFGFVHVLGRRDREQRQNGAHHAREDPGDLHRWHPTSSVGRGQLTTMDRVNYGSLSRTSLPASIMTTASAKFTASSRWWVT